MATVATDPSFPKSVLGDTGGLTKREFIASRLLTGMLAGSPTIDASMGDVDTKLVRKAVALADLLIKGLNGTL